VSDSHTTLALTTAAVALAVRLFVSVAEQSIRFSDPETLEALGRRGARGAERAHWFATRPEQLWTTTRLLGRASLLSASVLLAVALPHPAMALLVLVPFVFATAEVLPRFLLTRRAERIAPRLATPLMALFHLLRPVVMLTNGLARVLGRPDDDDRPAASREDLQRLVDQDSGESDMAVGERAMIARIFEFSHLTAADSMVPLKEMCALSADATVRDAVALIAREGYSRLPVYRDRLENIVGVLHHIDLLRAAAADQPVGAVTRPPLFVPETQEIDDILVILQRRAASAAIVVDEFGKTVGLLTLEDILEEIVGEIDDEFDPNERLWRPSPDGGYLVSARMTPAEFERVFDLELNLDEDDEIETMAGFVLVELKHIPVVGEAVTLGDDVKLTVSRANERAIEELHLTGATRARDA
jgi:putative hemolysin